MPNACGAARAGGGAAAASLAQDFIDCGDAPVLIKINGRIRTCRDAALAAGTEVRIDE